jgi:hypothetical protein
MIHIFIQTRRPSADGRDPGAAEEAWVKEVDGAAVLCNEDGSPLYGELIRSPIRPNETVREAGVRLLRGKIGRRRGSDFNRPLLKYPVQRF